MKVIMLTNIEKVGTKGEVVNVKRGYARNYLVPRNYAIYATPANVKRIVNIQAQAADEEEKRIWELKKLAEKINAVNLVFVRKVDEHGSMFGSVSETDIAHALHQHGIDVHKSLILMDKHIKELGVIAMQIRLHKDILADLNIRIEREGKEIPVVATEPEPIIEDEVIESSEPVEVEIVDEPGLVEEELETIFETEDIVETEDTEVKV
ncbi:MAG: 50S ribosomal protein L9 [Candidatus Cloacimonadaceae bacterium]|nr:50S ribosomal protein L9 [Candidatus Cloacimonadaceae bacterium]MDP3114126.1 50S ribosomal protein L9 [Candidatus Cloacimonadaceae bacterium]